jgi:hypothetical protein
VDPRLKQKNGTSWLVAFVHGSRRFRPSILLATGFNIRMLQVMATPGASTEVVFDSCPEIVQKIKKCLNDTPGLTKAAFCRIALEGSNSNALGKFLAAKKQHQQGNAVYRRAYAFFEKLRVMNGEQKTKARLKNEVEQGVEGFETSPWRHYTSYIDVVDGEFCRVYHDFDADE